MMDRDTLTIDMNMADAAALLQLLRLVGQEIEDPQWLEMRPNVVDLLACALDRLDAADRALAHLMTIAGA